MGQLPDRRKTAPPSRRTWRYLRADDRGPSSRHRSSQWGGDTPDRRVHPWTRAFESTCMWRPFSPATFPPSWRRRGSKLKRGRCSTSSSAHTVTPFAGASPVRRWASAMSRIRAAAGHAPPLRPLAVGIGCEDPPWILADGEGVRVGAPSLSRRDCADFGARKLADLSRTGRHQARWIIADLAHNRCSPGGAVIVARLLELRALQHPSGGLARFVTNRHSRCAMATGSLLQPCRRCCGISGHARMDR